MVHIQMISVLYQGNTNIRVFPRGVLAIFFVCISRSGTRGWSLSHKTRSSRLSSIWFRSALKHRVKGPNWSIHAKHKLYKGLQGESRCEGWERESRTDFLQVAVLFVGIFFCSPFGLCGRPLTKVPRIITTASPGKAGQFGSLCSQHANDTFDKMGNVVATSMKEAQRELQVRHEIGLLKFPRHFAVCACSWFYFFYSCTWQDGHTFVTSTTAMRSAYQFIEG